ncbi:MAG: hypothetical protein HY807_06190 [Nitrospirae bacterium]|nr:hypothetical protein [Nitrospirota bacterium]
MHKLILLILFVLTFAAGVINYAVSETARPSVILERDIKANMDAHIEKVKRKNPAKYQAMMDGANNTVSGCLSCHIDLLDSNKNKTRIYLQH